MNFITSLSLILMLNISLFAQVPSFGPREDKGLVEFAEINEASGITASKKNPDVLWLHNDSGDSVRIFAINQNGKHVGVYAIDNISNRDWEDIAVGPGPDSTKSYIYVAEIGDNLSQYNLKYIYRIPEPTVSPQQQPVHLPLGDAEVITLKYPDGPRDAETILIDPLTKDIYIISKRENNVRVYLAAYPQSLIDTLIVEHIATLPLTQIVGGDISQDGDEIVLKNYDSVYYWRRDLTQTFAEAFTNNQFYTLPYIREPQGEAICWSYNSNGYYTVSEEIFNIQAHLYFYPRLGPNSIEENKDEGLDFHLEQNYPNPFNPSTNIVYKLDSRQFISLKIYNILGEEISEIINEEIAPGKYEIVFNGDNLSNGIYFYKLQTKNHFEIRSMTLLK